MPDEMLTLGELGQLKEPGCIGVNADFALSLTDTSVQSLSLASLSGPKDTPTAGRPPAWGSMRCPCCPGDGEEWLEGVLDAWESSPECGRVGEGVPFLL